MHFLTIIVHVHNYTFVTIVTNVSMDIRFCYDKQGSYDDDCSSDLLQLAHHKDTNVKESTGSVGPSKDVQETHEPT